VRKSTFLRHAIRLVPPHANSMPGNTDDFEPRDRRWNRIRRLRRLEIEELAIPRMDAETQERAVRARVTASS